MVQVAKRGASVLKRRKSKNKMDQPVLNAAHNVSSNSSNIGALTTNLESTQNNLTHANRSESEDVVFYTEEPRAGKIFELTVDTPYINFLAMQCFIVNLLSRG